MASKVQLGVLKKKKNKPTNRKETAKWVQKVANYLKSDSYLFGPLLDSPLSTTATVIDSSSPPKVSFPDGIEYMARGRKNNNKGLGKKVVQYLKSDSYLYGPLLSSRPTIPGYVRRSKKLTMEMLMTKKVTRKDKQSTVEKSNVTVEQEEEFCDVVVLPPTTPDRNRSSGQQQQRSARRRQEVSSHVVPRRSFRSSSSSAVSVARKSLPSTRMKTLLIDH
ncbi:unnamed protein product [Linum tenue]|uniref:Uncharacterized protein n=1 Tax=Linum tenue TaxID=586396 RepID=A0AAV0I945_9ROSI|nr:unnamed protein product [Linum tenue]